MTPICPACGAKFSHDRKLLRCSKCGLPDEVLARGSEAIVEWKDQTTINKRLFGQVRARQNRDERKKQVRHPSRHKGSAAPVNAYRKLARLKRAG